MAAGAERVYHHCDLDALLDDTVRAAVFRPGDVIVLVQSNLLFVNAMRKIASEGVLFQIPGHDAVALPNDQAVREFRTLEPIGITVERRETRGAKRVWPALTNAQAKTLLEWWYTPEMKRRAIMERVREMVGADVPDHWVRDQVIRLTGSAARTPQNKEPG